jgi:hypothetical protein
MDEGVFARLRASIVFNWFPDCKAVAELRCTLGSQSWLLRRGGV